MDFFRIRGDKRYQQVDVEQNIVVEINLDIAEIKVKVTGLP